MTNVCTTNITYTKNTAMPSKLNRMSRRQVGKKSKPHAIDDSPRVTFKLLYTEKALIVDYPASNKCLNHNSNKKKKKRNPILELNHLQSNDIPSQSSGIYIICCCCKEYLEYLVSNPDRSSLPLYKSVSYFHLLISSSSRLVDIYT